MKAPAPVARVTPTARVTPAVRVTPAITDKGVLTFTLIPTPETCKEAIEKNQANALHRFIYDWGVDSDQWRESFAAVIDFIGGRALQKHYEGTIVRPQGHGGAR